MEVTSAIKKHRTSSSRGKTIDPTHESDGDSITTDGSNRKKISKEKKNNEKIKSIPETQEEIGESDNSTSSKSYKKSKKTSKSKSVPQDDIDSYMESSDIVDPTVVPEELGKKSKKSNKSIIIDETVAGNKNNNTEKTNKKNISDTMSPVISSNRKKDLVFDNDLSEEKKALLEKIDKLKSEINEMTEKNKEFKLNIGKFTKEFEKENGRPPDKDDRKREAKDLYSNYHKVLLPLLLLLK